MRDYCKSRGREIALFLLCASVFGVVSLLYGLPPEGFGYALLLCLVGALALWGWDYARWRGKRRRLIALREDILLTAEGLPEPSGALEADYHELIRLLREEQARLISQNDMARRELVDYYTLWVHQIKTPIAAMGLLLQGDDSDRGRELEAELFKIQQYVEMVLSYLRLDSDSSDYVIRDYPVEPIVRQAVRKYAPLFIRGKVSIALGKLDYVALTDEKWLSFVVEQLLSNAVKYAKGGSVSVCMEGDELVVRDDGMGIAPEDLPRVFEKGFTGCNGRADKKSTGIGLYLCRRVCGRLGHAISIQSRPGQGTQVRVSLKRAKLEVE